MTSNTKELNSILQTLDALQNRVREITEQDVEPTGHNPVVPVAEPDPGPTPVPAGEALSGLANIPGDHPHLELLVGGVHQLTSFTKLKDFPNYFAKFAGRTGLRMVLLKRWTSGLQVFMEKNIQLPNDAKRKGRDGRAPIPCSKGDIFQAVGDDATVYCGPVPVKHFPLDFTLMLGRGSADRRIIILPLPSQNHWNTFLYLDADQASEGALAIAEVLAHFALSRMCLLNKGLRSHTGRVQAILHAEIFRREKMKEGARKTVSANPHENDQMDDDTQDVEPLEFLTPPKVGAVDESETLELDPFEAPDSSDQTIALHPDDNPNPEASNLELSTLPEPEGNAPLTPESILRHSGELPALPKAACHIMAVIEDPKTTATRLEKALAMDQTLTAKVLRIANSPFYGAVREIRTVSEAIVRLGFVTIRNWTVVTATKSVFLTPGAGSLYQKIWHQSVMSAMASQLVGQTMGTAEPEGLFIGGLMQNIGQLVLARSHPQLFQDILTESENTQRPYHELEKKLLGFDHGELGALLIGDWNLSQELEQAVRWHHGFNHEDAQQARLGAMIALGEEIAHCSIGGPENQAEETETPGENDNEDSSDADLQQPLSEACQYLGITRGQFNDLREQAAKLRIDPHFFN